MYDQARGNTKRNEHVRTVELLEEILREQGLFFVIALIHDMQYKRDDLHAVMEIMRERGIKNLPE